MPEQLPKYITIAELAELRRTTPQVLYVQYSQRKNPSLPPRYKVGSRVLVRLDEALASIENGRII